MLRIIELRNYLLKPGRTGEFIRYFEEHFLFSQRDEGMHVLGQFEVVGEPDRFVWIRGFADMESRLRGLKGFYDGPFWAAHRDAANEMMIEFHDVHLLRALDPIESLTGGLSLEDRAAEPAGVVPPETGMVTVGFHRGEREEEPRPGRRVLGRFVTETAPNDFPRLPVIQEPDLRVVISAQPEGEAGPGMVLRPTARSVIRATSPQPLS